LLFAEGLIEEIEELAAENERERLDREEEGLAGRYPAPEIEGQRPSGNKAVQLEVSRKLFSPRTQQSYLADTIEALMLSNLGARPWLAIPNQCE
jgi:hypothetical protein